MSFHLPIEIWAALAAALVLGLVFGSFLNVCIVRLPVHRSIIKPRSHCDSCGELIHPLDNIPLASWLWLRGRCRACNAHISIQYPLVELGTAVLFIACVLQTGLAWQTLINAITCFFLLGLAVMDAQTMVLPDSFTLTGLVLAFIVKACTPGMQQRGLLALRTIEDAALAAAMLLLVWAIYWLVRRRHGVGMGDVKLLAMMAAFMGLPLALLAYFVGILAAALFAVVLVAQRKAGSFDRIPFGSFLAGAGIFVIFAGKPVITWYLSLLH